MSGTHVRNASDHLLTGLLFDDAGHRMAPTHATKAGIRYRYYVSLPCLHGEAKTAKVGSVTRVPATDIEDVVVKSLNEHVKRQSGMPAPAITGQGGIAELIDRIDVHKDRLAVRLRSLESPGAIKLSRPAIAFCPLPGRSRRRSDSGKSCCPMAHRETRSDPSGRNDYSGLSAPLHEAGAGWMSLSLDLPPAPSRLRCASDAASVMST
jgi:hypothetical protein